MSIDGRDGGVSRASFIGSRRRTGGDIFCCRSRRRDIFGCGSNRCCGRRRQSFLELKVCGKGFHGR